MTLCFLFLDANYSQGTRADGLWSSTKASGNNTIFFSYQCDSQMKMLDLSTFSTSKGCQLIVEDSSAFLLFVRFCSLYFLPSKCVNICSSAWLSLSSRQLPNCLLLFFQSRILLLHKQPQRFVCLINNFSFTLYHCTISRTKMKWKSNFVVANDAVESQRDLSFLFYKYSISLLFSWWSWDSLRKSRFEAVKNHF